MLSVTFNAAQDRLLLEIKDKEKSNYVWLTRRATVILAGVVEKLLVKMYAKSGVTDLDDTVARFSQEALDAAYPPKQVPTASTKTGTLAYRVGSTIIDATSARLAIHDPDGAGIRFVISRELLHLLLNLLKIQAAKAKWGIEIGFTPVGVGATATNLRQ